MRNLSVLSVKTLLSGLLCVSVASSWAQHPDTLWFKYDNRFLPNKCWRVADYDTLLFQTSMARGVSAQEGKAPLLISYPKNSEPGQFMFTRPGRYLYRPSSMNCDFTNSNSQWCFERSKESEHFVVFWEKGVNFDQNYILERAERAWDVYVNQLGFLTPGQSKGTDNYSPKAMGNLYATASYQIYKELSVYARLNNILGQKYQYYAGVPAQGFNFVGGISYSF